MPIADTALAHLLKRDRVVVAGALAVLTLLAWGYVLWLAAHMAMAPPAASDGSAMAGMNMGGMDMEGMEGIGGLTQAIAPDLHVWAPADFGFMFAMWSVMMVGMMTPSVAPMVLLYSAVGRKAVESGAPFAPTAWFFAGYLAVWIGFSAAATFAQWALTSLALLTPLMAAASMVLGGAILVAAGLYQWTPFKGACLKACQAPLGFLMAHGGFRGKPLGALRLGAAHGLYCLGCCAALMAILFVGGIMNLLWIAGLTILVFVEKIVPTGRVIPRISGAVMGVAGAWLIVRAL